MTEPRLGWSQLPAAPTTPINQTLSHCWQEYTSRTKLFAHFFQPTCDTQDMDFHRGAAISNGCPPRCSTNHGTKWYTWYFAGGLLTKTTLQWKTHTLPNQLSECLFFFSFFFQTSNNPSCARVWQYGGSCGVTPLTRYYQCCTLTVYSTLQWLWSSV